MVSASLIALATAVKFGHGLRPMGQMKRMGLVQDTGADSNMPRPEGGPGCFRGRAQ